MTAMLTRTEHMTSLQANTALRGLFIEHRLFGWTVRFGSAKRTAGTCDHGNKTIPLSKYLMAQRSYEDSMMTITHEIAHALTPGHSHDAVWARQHRALGGNGKRCFQHTDDSANWKRCHQRNNAEMRIKMKPQLSEALIVVSWDTGDETGNNGFWVVHARGDEIASWRENAGDNLPELLSWAAGMAVSPS